MLMGIDISNHQGPPSIYRDQPWYRDAEFVIVQAIEPPAGYAGWDHTDAVSGRRGYTGEQLQAAREDGKKVGVYAWLWNMLPDPFNDIRARLNIVPANFPLDMRPWVDVEDTSQTTVAIRKAATLAARRAADEWALARALPPSGGYSGGWYINGYLDGWWPEDWLYWMADYSIPPELYPSRPVHQYASTPIDQNAMLESEIVARGEPEMPAVDQAWQARKPLIVQTAGELLSLSDQLLAEANRPNGPRKSVVKRLADPELKRRAEAILA